MDVGFRDFWFQGEVREPQVPASAPNEKLPQPGVVKKKVGATNPAVPAREKL